MGTPPPPPRLKPWAEGPGAPETSPDPGAAPRRVPPLPRPHVQSLPEGGLDRPLPQKVLADCELGGLLPTAGAEGAGRRSQRLADPGTLRVQRTRDGRLACAPASLRFHLRAKAQAQLTPPPGVGGQTPLPAPRPFLPGQAPRPPSSQTPAPGTLRSVPVPSSGGLSEWNTVTSKEAEELM